MGIETEANVIDDKKVTKTARKLQKKYNAKRVINEKYLRKKTPKQKFLAILSDCVCIFFVLLLGFSTFTTVKCYLQNIPPSICGYSTMTVASGSMKKSGFEIGCKVTIREVDKSTLKDGDIIAFYVDDDAYFRDTSSYTRIEKDSVQDLKFILSKERFFGLYPQHIQDIASEKKSLIFHQIISVYEDDNGKRYFNTKGSSNDTADSWVISEDYVVGAYDSSAFAKMISSVVYLFTSSYGLILLVTIILMIMIVLIVSDSMKDVQMAMLEYDIVEEKRKLTDPICLKHNVGLKMDEKTKYKVLVQASEEDRPKYIELLWKNGEAPLGIRKYIMRHQILLLYDKKLLEVNRICENRIKAGENPNKVAKFYIEEKDKIVKERTKKEQQLRQLRKKYDDEKVLEIAEKEMLEDEEREYYCKLRESQKNLVKNKRTKTDVSKEIQNELKQDTEQGVKNEKEITASDKKETKKQEKDEVKTNSQKEVKKAHKDNPKTSSKDKLIKSDKTTKLKTTKKTKVNSNIKEKSLNKNSK